VSAGRHSPSRLIRTGQWRRIPGQLGAEQGRPGLFQASSTPSISSRHVLA